MAHMGGGYTLLLTQETKGNVQTPTKKHDHHRGTDSEMEARYVIMERKVPHVISSVCQLIRGEEQHRYRIRRRVYRYTTVVKAAVLFFLY